MKINIASVKYLWKKNQYINNAKIFFRLKVYQVIKCLKDINNIN